MIISADSQSQASFWRRKSFDSFTNSSLEHVLVARFVLLISKPYPHPYSQPSMHVRVFWMNLLKCFQNNHTVLSLEYVVRWHIWKHKSMRISWNRLLCWLANTLSLPEVEWKRLLEELGGDIWDQNGDLALPCRPGIQDIALAQVTNMNRHCRCGESSGVYWLTWHPLCDRRESCFLGGR